jgi:hypothetical protein
MAQKLSLNLPSADDLFSTQEEREDAQREKVVDISRSEIDIFPDHPFQVKIDNSMLALVESVKTVGIQTPAVVRKKEDGRYEYISGHRRNMARELARIDLIPELLQMVDNAELREKDKPQIAMRPAVELSYLTKEQQQFVLSAIGSECCTPSHDQTLRMRGKIQRGRIGRGRYPVHHAGGKTKSSGTIQVAKRENQPILCAGDARAKD